MAMGKRRGRPKQTSMWVATQELPRTAAHPFYTRLNQILDKADFDEYVEALCQRFYADEVGRPGLPPGRYFRLLLIGYFEGLDAERAIAWRAADSFALREFLGLVLPEAPPDHSTISRTRRLIDLETHEAVFTWILQQLADAGLVKGKTIGIDATTLEANAALRSIVRRDTGATYQAFLTQLAQASGIDTPTREDLARLDRKRPKKGSNDDWTHPLDPDAKITKMKDGRTHLAHKAEHAVDLETGAVVAVTVQGADEGDTITSVETLIEAAEQIETVVPEGEGLKEVVADKGYHSNQELVDLEAVGVRSYISEPDRGRRNWKDNPDARDAVYRNRRRIRGARGKRLLRQRGERLERPFAHLYETGRMRRVHLRGHTNILKRVLLHTAALNLGLLMRTLYGVGTPRSLQGRVAALLRCVWSFIRRPETLWDVIWTMYRPSTSPTDLLAHREIRPPALSVETVFTTGC
jgi:transposase